VRESALSVTGSEGNLTAVIVALATLGIIAR
jgi:hypothetical protein